MELAGLEHVGPRCSAPIAARAARDVGLTFDLDLVRSQRCTGQVSVVKPGRHGGQRMFRRNITRPAVRGKRKLAESMILARARAARANQSAF